MKYKAYLVALILTVIYGILPALDGVASLIVAAIPPSIKRSVRVGIAIGVGVGFVALMVPRQI